MSRFEPQLNIRSAFARERATALARRTGRTTTQVVEDALRAFDPQAPEADEDLPLPPSGLIRKGWLLVMPADGRRKITAEEAQAAIDDAREERADAIWNCT